jgi:photosystem II stability/assembly factor-like uncharacterized protein
VTRWALRLLCLMLTLASSGPSVRAHDPSTYGGLFRSRNLGETWLNADAGQFVNAALTVALDPRDSSALLLATDTGLLRSQSGGRSWTPEARDLIFGPVFAIASSPDGETVLCSSASGVFRRQAGAWTPSSAPDGAAPARAIAFGAERDRIYLLGAAGLFASSDRGRSFQPVATELAAGAPMTMLAVATTPSELLVGVIDHKLMVSQNGGKGWLQRMSGLAATPVDTGALDPFLASRAWAASGDQIYLSDDLGVGWHAVGRPLPEAQTSVRGIAADPTASTLIVTSHRGMYRSTDGGSSWELKEGTLPIHLEAGPLVRDPHDPRTLYAVYSLMPYPEVWRTAVQGGNLLARVDTLSLAGGFAFLVLLMLAAGFLVGWLQRLRRPRAAPSGSRL